MGGGRGGGEREGSGGKGREAGIREPLSIPHNRYRLC